MIGGNVNLQLVRLLLAGCIALVVLALLLVILVALLRGVPLTAQSIIGLVSFVALLVGVIGNLVGTRVATGAVSNVQANQAAMTEKLNGHLAAHGVVDESPAGPGGGPEVQEA